MPFKSFVDLTPLYAADVNTFLMSQTVARFDALTTRDAAITGPVAGQMCWTPTRGLQIHTGTAWAPAPGTVLAKLRRTATANVGNGAVIPLDEEIFDLYTAHSTTTNISRYVCPVAGNYLVAGSVHHGVMTAGTTVIGHLYVNGSAQSSHPQAASASPTAGSQIDFLDLVQANAGDYLELVVGNSAAASTNAAGSYMVVTYAGF